MSSGKRASNGGDGGGGDAKRAKWTMPTASVWMEQGRSIIDGQTVSVGEDGKNIFVVFDTMCKSFKAAYFGKHAALHALVAGLLEREEGHMFSVARATMSMWAAQATSSGDRTGTVTLTYRMYDKATADEQANGPAADPKRRYHIFRVAQPFKVVTAGFVNLPFMLGKYLKREAALALVMRQIKDNYELDEHEVIVVPESINFNYDPSIVRGGGKGPAASASAAAVGDGASVVLAAVDEYGDLADMFADEAK